jgi:hypothetical protein
MVIVCCVVRWVRGKKMREMRRREEFEREIESVVL